MDALAKQVPGASLQSEESHSAINRFCEIAAAMGRCTWRQIEQAAEKCDALLAGRRNFRERQTHSLGLRDVCEARVAGPFYVRDETFCPVEGTPGPDWGP